MINFLQALADVSGETGIPQVRLLMVFISKLKIVKPSEYIVVSDGYHNLLH